MRLVVGNLNYSSWSMRAWLVLRRAGVDFQIHDVGIFTKPDWRERVLQFSGAGKVPILVDGSSTIHESLAIAETMAERYPEARLWPEDPALRARARALSAEMASSFFHLRNQMPANLRGRSSYVPQGAGLQADLARVFDIFEASLSTSPGDFLLGDFGIVDCMFMPVLSRFRTWGVPLSDPIAGYSERVMGLPVVRELEELARGTEPIDEYDALLESPASLQAG